MCLSSLEQYVLKNGAQYEASLNEDYVRILLIPVLRICPWNSTICNPANERQQPTNMDDLGPKLRNYNDSDGRFSR